MDKDKRKTCRRMETRRVYDLLDGSIEEHERQLLDMQLSGGHMTTDRRVRKRRTGEDRRTQ